MDQTFRNNVFVGENHALSGENGARKLAPHEINVTAHPEESPPTRDRSVPAPQRDLAPTEKLHHTQLCSLNLDGAPFRLA